MSLAAELAAEFDVDEAAAEAMAAWLIRRGVGGRGGRRRSRKERPECPELGATSRRFAKALATRAAEGDTEALEQLVEVRAAVDEAIVSAARSLHAFDYSWTDIARVLGVSRQAARQRFGIGEEVSA